MGIASKRFVILHHVGCERSHWDFLLEQEEALATWQLYQDPLAGGKELFRIEDHRKMYLDYEGPIEGNRGEVTRVCAGTYELLEQNSQLWRVQFTSNGLSGRFDLSLQEDSRWMMVEVGE